MRKTLFVLNQRYNLAQDHRDADPHQPHERQSHGPGFQDVGLSQAAHAREDAESAVVHPAGHARPDADRDGNVARVKTEGRRA